MISHANETIAASHAGLAVDLRAQIRERLAAGESAEQIRSFMVERYGNFVLYRPPLEPATWLLWIGPFVLLLAATALFAFGPQLRSMLAGGKPSTAKATVGVLAVAAYGGYFNGGLGILLLALFGLLGQTQLNAMNGLKNWVSALLTAIAVVIYAAGGVVQWPQALMMMVAATAGGYGGARLARKLPANVLRWGIVATGLVMAAVFFWRQ